MGKKSMLLVLPCFLLLSAMLNLESAASAERKMSDLAANQSLEDTALVSVAYNPDVMDYSDEDEVYSVVKQALEQLNPGDPVNPLSNLIEPGDVVVLKPNLVGASRIAFEGCTRAPVLRPIIDLAVEAGASKVVVAEGPARPNWEDEVFYSANITGLVDEMQIKHPGVSISYQNLNKDNWTWVDLGQYSTFSGVYTAQELYSVQEIRMDQDSYYYATDSKGYNPHGYTPGLYAIANTIFEADLLINVPKMKVHHITGVTMSLKNLIGITVSDTGNTTNQESIKDVPHWNTSYSHAGEDKRRIDASDNDVIWRVNADLHKLALYADRNGNLQPTKQRKYLSVLDGIVGMEGPLVYDEVPDPRPTGAVLAGQDPVALDIVGSRVMGFNYTALFSLTNMAKVSDHIFGTADPTKICVLGVSLTRETFGESYVPHINYEDDKIHPYEIRLQRFDPPEAEVIKTDPETPLEGVETRVVVYTRDIDLVGAGWLRYSLDGGEPMIMKMVPNAHVMGNLGLLEGGTRVLYDVCLQDYFFNTDWSDKISVYVYRRILFFSLRPDSFSPNGDGRRDTTAIIAAFSTAVNWILEIRNSSGAVTRSWNGTATFKWQSAMLQQVWNGTDEAEKSVCDGTYNVTLTGKDSHGILFEPETITLTVDTAKPTISNISDHPDPINPSVGEATTINYTLSEKCHVMIMIRDPWGRTVKMLRGTQPARANSVTWDGKIQRLIAPDGTYRYEIHAVDMAGNRATPATGTTTIKT